MTLRVVSFGGGDGARFWRKVDQRGGADACWPWMGKPNEKGYGRFTFRYRTEIAHRVAFYLAYGHWPQPYALHRCDNPPCCNPAHLFEGTIADNNADMRAKGRGRNPPAAINGGTFGYGRSSVGEQHPRAKLTRADVLELRRLRAQGWKVKALAARYGMSTASASKVARAQTYTEVNDGT